VLQQIIVIKTKLNFSYKIYSFIFFSKGLNGDACESNSDCLSNSCMAALQSDGSTKSVCIAPFTVESGDFCFTCLLYKSSQI
jgi:hypothetical protein